MNTYKYLWIIYFLRLHTLLEIQECSYEGKIVNGIFKDDTDRGVDIDTLLGGKVYSIDDDWQKPIELYKKFKGIA